MPGKAAFVVRFLVVFAVVILLGWATDATTYYARALRATAAVVSPLLTGWWLDARTGAKGTELWFHRGEEQMKLLLALEALALGILPLVALVTATPGLGWRRWAAACVIGCAALFVLDLAVLILYPWMVGNPSALTDIVGTFLGLLTFVGGPVILWFALTFDRLRPVWRLDSGAKSGGVQASPRRRGRR